MLPSAGPQGCGRRRPQNLGMLKTGTSSHLLRWLLSCPSCSAVGAVGFAMFHFTVILPIKPSMPVKCTASSWRRFPSATAAPARSTQPREAWATHAQGLPPPACRKREREGASCLSFFSPPHCDTGAETGGDADFYFLLLGRFPRGSPVVAVPGAGLLAKASGGPSTGGAPSGSPARTPLPGRG